MHIDLVPRSTQRRVLLLVVVVAFSLRLGWSVYAASVPRHGDPVTYYLYGDEISRGQGYSSAADLLQRIVDPQDRGVLRETPRGQPVPTALFPPGWPAVLGAVFWVSRHSPLPDDAVAATVALNIALSVATVVMAYAITRRLFDARVALVAAALLAVYPNLIWHTATMRWETTFIFLSMAALLLILRQPLAEKRLGTGTLILFGLLTGASGLIRPMSFAMLLILLIVRLANGASARRALAEFGIVVLVVALMVAPWTIRNIVKLNSPVIISTGFGAALCASRVPGAHGNLDYSRLTRYCQPSTKGIPIERQEVRGNNFAIAQAVNFVLAHPVRELELWPQREFYAFRQDHDALDDVHWVVPASTWRALARVSDWYFLVVLVLGLLGARYFARRHRPDRQFVLLTAISLALTPIVLFGDPRYKVPLTPLLAVLAAPAVVRAYDAASSAISRREAAPEPVPRRIRAREHD